MHSCALISLIRFVKPIIKLKAFLNLIIIRTLLNSSLVTFEHSEDTATILEQLSLALGTGPFSSHLTR